MQSGTTLVKLHKCKAPGPNSCQIAGSKQYWGWMTYKRIDQHSYKIATSYLGFKNKGSSRNKNLTLFTLPIICKYLSICCLQDIS